MEAKQTQNTAVVTLICFNASLRCHQLHAHTETGYTHTKTDQSPAKASSREWPNWVKAMAAMHRREFCNSGWNNIRHFFCAGKPHALYSLLLFVGI